MSEELEESCYFCSNDKEELNYDEDAKKNLCKNCEAKVGLFKYCAVKTVLTKRLLGE